MPSSEVVWALILVSSLRGKRAGPAGRSPSLIAGSLGHTRPLGAGGRRPRALVGALPGAAVVAESLRSRTASKHQQRPAT